MRSDFKPEVDFCSAMKIAVRSETHCSPQGSRQEGQGGDDQGAWQSDLGDFMLITVRGSSIAFIES
jgi:hypothetical protein